MFLQHSRFAFVPAATALRIAYTICGSGPTLIRAPHWMSSINLELDSPVWRHWIALLARHHTLIRFDQRGCGLSDRDGVEFSFERFVDDFEAVVEAACLDRFDLFGFSGGATTGIAYAARYPHRVNRFIIAAALPMARFQRRRLPNFVKRRQCSSKRSNSVGPTKIRHFVSSLRRCSSPTATVDQFRLFNEQIRLTTPPANGKRIIEAIWNADIRSEAAKLQRPALVFHSRQDGRIPFEQGRELAGLILGARFVPLESRNHLIFETEPALEASGRGDQRVPTCFSRPQRGSDV